MDSVRDYVRPFSGSNAFADLTICLINSRVYTLKQSYPVSASPFRSSWPKSLATCCLLYLVSVLLAHVTTLTRTLWEHSVLSATSKSFKRKGIWKCCLMVYYYESNNYNVEQIDHGYRCSSKAIRQIFN